MTTATPKNILIPVDLSEHSAKALAYGMALAERIGAQVVAMHVLRPAFDYVPLEQAVWGATVTVDQLSDRLEENAKKEFDGFLARHCDASRGLPEHELGNGEPAQTVLARAEAGKFDLIVVGSHGHEGLSRWVMGSVAERIVRHAQCPVLVVH